MKLQQTQLTHPKYRADIDGLRAIAVLAVVAFHAFPNWLRGGFIGVDVFFVISGFLISTIIFENLDRGTFSFKEFYARRIKRIFPALILVLIACFAFGWFALLADEYKQLGKHIAAGAGFVSNFVLWGEAGYFDNSAETKPLLHLWSLGIEEQFYIVWPFVLWFAWKRKFNLVIMTVIVAVASFVLNIKGIKQDSVATFYSPQTRFWELLSGSLLAWLVLYQQPFINKITTQNKILANLLSLTGMLLLVFGVWRINHHLSFPGQWALVPVLASILIIIAGSMAWFNRVILSNKIIVWFGIISFPLYLWHWPILSFASILESETPSLIIRAGLILLSIFLAWLTYELIERPIRFGVKNKFKIPVLVILMVVVGNTGYFIFINDGLHSRNIDKNEGFNSVAFDWPKQKKADDNCNKKISPFKSDYCLASTSYPLKVGLIGDSHANTIFDFVQTSYAKKGIGVIQLGKPGCPPLVNIEKYEIINKKSTKGCNEAIQGTLSYLNKNSEINHVIIAGFFAQTVSGFIYRKEDRPKFLGLEYLKNEKITDRKKIFELGLRDTLDQLLHANKKVTIILDVPELNFSPKICLNRLKSKECRIEKHLVMQRQSAYREIISKIALDYKFQSVDLMDAFCDELYCYAKSDGKILYRDNDHLGIWGSEYLINKNFKLDE